jgi:transcription elongation factor GreA
MSSINQNLKLGEAASRFLVSLPSEEVGISQQVIYQFVRWFGRERLLAKLAADEIANYAQRISSSDTDYLRKLDLVRAFLTHARKAGWIENNLAVHLKAKKGKPKLATGIRQASTTVISLTQQGYDEIKEELEALKRQRPKAIEEVHRAAEDKDFRENAPLDAARERLSYLEGKIRELEETLKSATLVKERVEISPKLGVGDSIVLLDLTSGEELHYTIVNPREVDPARGKISSASPLGKAIMGRGRGDIVEIAAPAGRLRYRIEQVKH